MERPASSLVSLLVFAIVALGLPHAAHAQAGRSFGPHDVRTIFHIAKSDDRNRVDYGIHLDADCQPVGRSPVYAYWHRFEPGEPRYGELNPLDRQLYGIRSQRVRTRSANGTWTEMRINALPGYRILVLTQRTADGCQARARAAVNHRPAFIHRVFVQLGGPFSVDHVVFRGVDATTHRPVVERRLPP